MFVDEGYRNLKIGKKLLDKVIMTCKEQNIDGIYLGTIDKFISDSIFILIMASEKLSEEIYQVVFLN